MEIPNELVYEIVDLLKTHDDESAEDVLFTLQELVAMEDD